LFLKVSKIKIEVSSNFINREDCKSFIDFINTNQNIFVGPLGRTVLQFGFDDHRKNYTDTVSGIESINNLAIIYFNKIIKELKNIYNEDKELYIASFWLSKGMPGSRVRLHSDQEDGYNSHFKYSTISYFNSVDSGNEIIFPNIGYKYSPVEGDMLSWISGDKDSIHEVPSVTETRYSMPIWVTDNPKYKLNYEMI
jgi:hypothetical protein